MRRKKTAPLLALALFILCNCDNEPYEGSIFIEDNPCELAIENTVSAETDFNLGTEENSETLCQIYRNALENQIETCGDINGDLQGVLEDLGNCTSDISENQCENAINASELALLDYNEAEDEDIEGFCNAYKEALAYQIEVCGDDGSLQLIIDDLGDCAPNVFNVVGDWKLTSIYSINPLDLNNDGQTSDNYLNEIDCFDNETILFNPDGTGTLFFRSEWITSFTPIPNSNDVNYNIDCISINSDETFTWQQLDINTIRVVLDDGGIIYDFIRNFETIFVARLNNLVAPNTEDPNDIIEVDILNAYQRL